MKKKNTTNTTNTTKITGTLKEAKKFGKDIVFMRCYAITMKDEHGQVMYTFDSKKKADEFYKELTKTK